MAEREILSIHIGGSGIDMGYHMWDQFIAEHKINSDGIQIPIDKHNNVLKDYVFFNELRTKSPKKFKPRSLFIDTDKDKIDEIKKSLNSKLFYSQCVPFNSGMIMDKIRKTLESYNSFQGFMLYRSASGQTSTLFSQLLSAINDKFGEKKIFCEYMTYPSTLEYAQNHKALCNTLLNFHNSCEHIDISFVLDNEKIRSITERYLKSHIICPNGFYSMNEYIAKLISGTTATLRSSKTYTGLVIKNMNDYIEHLVGRNRQSHYCTASFVPIEPKNDYLSKCEAKKRILIDGFCRDATNLYVAQDVNQIIYDRFYGYFEPYQLMKEIEFPRCRKYLRIQKLYFLSVMNSHISIKAEKADSSEEKNYWYAHLNVRGSVKGNEMKSAYDKSFSRGRIINASYSGTRCSQTHGSTAERKDSKCIIKQQEVDCTMMGKTKTISLFFEKRIMEPYKKRMKNRKKDEMMENGFLQMQNL